MRSWLSVVGVAARAEGSSDSLWLRRNKPISVVPVLTADSSQDMQWITSISKRIGFARRWRTLEPRRSIGEHERIANTKYCRRVDWRRFVNRPSVVQQ